MNGLLAAACSAALAFAGGAYLGYRYCEGRHAIDAAKAQAAVVKRVEVQGQVNTAVAMAAQAEHDRIVYRTRTLIEKVPQYVTREADRDCHVRRGFIELLNDAAINLPAAPAGPSESADAPSGVELSSVGTSVAANYGICNANAANHRALLDWAAQSGLMQ